LNATSSPEVAVDFASYPPAMRRRLLAYKRRKLRKR
jgi:hypothetical protein